MIQKVFSLKRILCLLLTSQLIACVDAKITDLVPASSADNSDQNTEVPTTPPVAGFNLADEVNKFKLRYNVSMISQRITDNDGEGDPNLYGTRNFRVVLHGVMYRGGGNNTKLVENPRSNTNPLPTIGLNNLCKEDFAAAVYLYSENFDKAPKEVSCSNTSHQEQDLVYKQYAAAGENAKILAMIYDRIKGKLDGPVYAHCWNGWHSSGLIAGMALKQFCGWSDAKVDAYWVQNTDGNYQGFEAIRSKLKAFKPYSKYLISTSEKNLICP